MAKAKHLAIKIFFFRFLSEQLLLMLQNKTVKVQSLRFFFSILLMECCFFFFFFYLQDDVDDDETRRSSVMSAELASSVEGLAVSADDAEGEETSSWMHTSTNTLSDGEDVNHPAWRNHKKHVFILSEAGKPVYSR